MKPCLICVLVTTLIASSRGQTCDLNLVSICVETAIGEWPMFGKVIQETVAGEIPGLIPENLSQLCKVTDGIDKCVGEALTNCSGVFTLSYKLLLSSISFVCNTSDVYHEHSTCLSSPAFINETASCMETTIGSIKEFTESLNNIENRTMEMCGSLDDSVSCVARSSSTTCGPHSSDYMNSYFENLIQFLKDFLSCNTLQTEPIAVTEPFLIGPNTVEQNGSESATPEQTTASTLSSKTVPSVTESMFADTTIIDTYPEPTTTTTMEPTTTTPRNPTTIFDFSTTTDKTSTTEQVGAEVTCNVTAIAICVQNSLGRSPFYEEMISSSLKGEFPQISVSYLDSLCEHTDALHSCIDSETKSCTDFQLLPFSSLRSTVDFICSDEGKGIFINTALCYGTDGIVNDTQMCLQKSKETTKLMETVITNPDNHIEALQMCSVLNTTAYCFVNSAVNFCTTEMAEAVHTYIRRVLEPTKNFFNCYTMSTPLPSTETTSDNKTTIQQTTTEHATTTTMKPTTSTIAEASTTTSMEPTTTTTMKASSSTTMEPPTTTTMEPITSTTMEPTTTTTIEPATTTTMKASSSTSMEPTTTTTMKPTTTTTMEPTTTTTMEATTTTAMEPTTTTTMEATTTTAMESTTTSTIEATTTTAMEPTTTTTMEATTTTAMEPTTTTTMEATTTTTMEPTTTKTMEATTTTPRNPTTIFDFSTISSTEQVNAEVSCNESAIAICVQNTLGRSPYYAKMVSSSLKGEFPQISVSYLDSMCEYTAALNSCLDSETKGCTELQLLPYSSLRSTFDFICSDEGKGIFINTALCYGTDGIVNDTQMCLQKSKETTKLMETVITNPDNHIEALQMCSVLNTTAHCFVNSAMNFCTLEEVEAVYTYINRVLEPTKNFFNCDTMSSPFPSTETMKPTTSTTAEASTTTSMEHTTTTNMKASSSTTMGPNTTTTMEPSTTTTVKASSSTTMEPNTTTTMESSTTTTVKASSSTSMEPTTSTTMEPTTTTTMEPSSTTSIEPTTTTNMKASSSTTMEPTTTTNMKASSSTTMEPTTSTTMEPSSTTSIEPTTTTTIEPTTTTTMEPTTTTKESTTTTMEPTTTTEIVSSTNAMEPTTDSIVSFDCNATVISDCVSQTIGRSPLYFAILQESLNGEFPRLATDQLDDLCMYAEDLHACFTPAIQGCIGLELLPYSSLESTLNFICGEGRQDFLETATCYDTTPEIVEDTKACLREPRAEIGQLMTLMSFSPDFYDESFQLCNLLDTTAYCFVNSAINYCTGEQATSVANYLSSVLETTKVFFACNSGTITPRPIVSGMSTSGKTPGTTTEKPTTTTQAPTTTTQASATSTQASTTTTQAPTTQAQTTTTQASTTSTQAPTTTTQAPTTTTQASTTSTQASTTTTQASTTSTQASTTTTQASTTSTQAPTTNTQASTTSTQAPTTTTQAPTTTTQASTTSTQAPTTTTQASTTTEPDTEKSTTSEVVTEKTTTELPEQTESTTPSGPTDEPKKCFKCRYHNRYKYKDDDILKRSQQYCEVLGKAYNICPVIQCQCVDEEQDQGQGQANVVPSCVVSMPFSRVPGMKSWCEDMCRIDKSFCKSDLCDCTMVSADTLDNNISL